MKKLLLGAILGAAAGAVGYKFYKENEDDIKDFFDESLSEKEDIDITDINLEDLEELRDCIDEMIDAKLNNEIYYDDACSHQDESSFEDSDFDENEKNDDYICIVQNSGEKEEK